MKPRNNKKRAATLLARAGEIIYSTRRKIATGAAGLLAATLGFHVIFGQNGILAFQAKLRDAGELRLQVERMRIDNEKLRSHVDRLAQDPNAIEHQAREELHYTRPGEVILSLPPNGSKAHHLPEESLTR